MPATAAQSLQAHPDAFGLEEIDVLDDSAEEPWMRLHVLWESAQGMLSLRVLATRNCETGNLTMIGCTSPDVYLTHAPLDLAHWVETDHQVWERCRSEWARYLEWREP